MKIQSKIAPCLWFDSQGEDAAKFYVSVFRNSKILKVARYPKAGQEVHGKPEGAVMTVDFELDGQRFMALNGGPHFKFNEAISLMVACETQEEIDHFWKALGAGGPVEAQQCGWIKDRFGLSWQIVPANIGELMSGPDPKASERAFAAMMKMKKLDIAALKKAAAG